MTGSSRAVLIGIDLGTSGLKVVASLATGETLARASAAYPTMRPGPNASEQDPATWLAAFRSALRDLSERVPTKDWVGMGLSGMLPTLVTTDESGTPVGPAITWEDARAEPQALALRDDVGPDQLYRLTGQWLDGRYLLPMLLRLQIAEPDRLRRTAWVLGAKDYLFWWLTGERATDPSTASGYGCYDLSEGVWLTDVVAAAAESLVGPMPAFPTIRPAAHAAALTADSARSLGVPAGVPIVLGAADSVLAASALGVCKSGDVAYVAGTSTVILGVSDRLVFDPAHRYLVTPMVEPGSWGLEMDLLATGSAVRWLAGLLGTSEATLVDLATAEDPRRAPTFLPYVAPGEQGALWDPMLSGTITGLALHHNSADLARGLLTGLILESRRCLDVLAEVTSTRGSVRVAGSSASSAALQQELADSSGRRILVDTSTVDHSALGAALLTASALGFGEPERHPALSAGVDPDPRLAPMWQELATRHDEVLAAFRALRVTGRAG
jgi:xylulokinase